MKNLMIYSTLLSSIAAFTLAIAQQTPAPSQPAPTTAPQPGPALAPAPVPATAVQPAAPPAAPAAPPAAPAPTAAIPTAEVKPAAPAASPGAANGPDKGLRFNFRGVPLETVLKYMSEAAGFVIIPEAKVEGTVDVWSYQPVTKDEAVQLLNTVLNKKGYAALRNEKVLTIVARDEARKRDIPVKQGSNPLEVPKNDEMVTQIIPVRYANAVQLTRDLTPLLPTDATLTANESGNALVLTDTQASIRRMMEIVKALDTSISSISSIRVFPLRYADAKELASIVKELFDSSGSQQNRGGRGPQGMQQFFNAMRGGRGGPPGGIGGLLGGMMGGPGGGGPGGMGGQGGTGVSEARTAASRVVAVADERTNSLVVSAPDEYIPTIEKLVEEVDTLVDDLTVLRVFHLKNADPTYMSQQLATLFPDETRSQNQQGRGGFQFMGRGGMGGMPGFGGRGGGSSQSQSSERMKKMGRVLSVPDARTSSLIVSASAELMPQIAQMIEELDVDPARKQRVFVFPLDNANVEDVEGVLADMFQSSNIRSSSRMNQNRNNNALNNRQMNTSRMQGAGGMGGRTTGNTGFGGGGFGGN